MCLIIVKKADIFQSIQNIVFIFTDIFEIEKALRKELKGKKRKRLWSFSRDFYLKRIKILELLVERIWQEGKLISIFRRKPEEKNPKIMIVLNLKVV